MFILLYSGICPIYNLEIFDKFIITRFINFVLWYIINIHVFGMFSQFVENLNVFLVSWITLIIMMNNPLIRFFTTLTFLFSIIFSFHAYESFFILTFIFILRRTRIVQWEKYFLTLKENQMGALGLEHEPFGW